MAISDFYCSSSYGQINWQIHPPVVASSGQEWQFYISTVRPHIGRSTGRLPPPVLPSNGHLTFLLLDIYWQIKWQIYTPQYWHLVVKNGNFTFLLLDIILADEVADLSPQ